MRHEALYHAKYQTLEATLASAMTALLRRLSLVRGLINLNCLRHLPAFDAPDDDNP